MRLSTSLQELVERTQAAGLVMNAEEIADVLWLAACLPIRKPDIGYSEPPINDSTSLPSVPQMVPNDGTAPDRINGSEQTTYPQDRQPRNVETPHQSEINATTLFQATTEKARTDESVVTASPLRISKGRALPNARALACALRPVMRRVASRTAKEVDEVATAERIAEQQLNRCMGVPFVLRPSSKRWLDVALIEDTSNSMMVWHETVRAFRDLLSVQGAFRDVRLWRLDTQSATAPRLFFETDEQQAKPLIPHATIQALSERLILVMTDCVAPAWQDSRMRKTLSSWAASGNVALLQLLPVRMWGNTVLGHSNLLASSYVAGTCSARLTLAATDDIPAFLVAELLAKRDTDNGSIPIIALEPHALEAYARVLTGLGHAKVPVRRISDIRLTKGNSANSVTVSTLLQRFRAMANPIAQRLAGYLSLVPLTLSVMHLIQTVMLPESEQQHLAEFLTSGLVSRSEQLEALYGEPTFEFVSGMRDILERTVRRADVQRVWQATEQYLEERTGMGEGFAAVYVDQMGTQTISLDSMVKPFAQLKTEAMEWLGWQDRPRHLFSDAAMQSPLVLRSLLDLKYSITLGKIIYALQTGSTKPVPDNVIKTGEGLEGERAEALLATRTTLDTILTTIETQINSNAEWNGTGKELQEAIAEAEETLRAGFSFDTLAKNLIAPEYLPDIWRRKRLPKMPTVLTSLQIRHNLLLKATAIALIEHIMEFPAYHNWYVGYVVQNFGDILDSAQTEQEVLEAIRGDFREFLGRQGAEDALFEYQYRKALIRYHNKVELFIEEKRLDPEYTEQTLSVAYVNLSLAQGRTEQRYGSSVSADRLLERRTEAAPNVFVIGKAGSGKTTLLRWLAIQAATIPEQGTMSVIINGAPFSSKTFSSLGFDWRDKVPLLVRLRLWDTEGMPTPEQFLSKGEKYDGVPQGWALRILRAGRGLVLLDGLDELSKEKRNEALRWIRALTEEYPHGNIFVASSRPQAVKPGALHDAGFQEYAVQDLSIINRIELINKWHEAIANRLGAKLSDSPNILDMRKRILNAIETNIAVRTLASNPLLCALMCALNRFYREELPNDLGALCESACQMLLWDRDFRVGLTQGTCPAGYERLSKADRNYVAQCLAYDMVKDAGATLPRATALTTIRKALRRKPDEDDQLTRDVLEGLIQRSGLVRPCDEEDIEFAHNVLRDYLASSQFVDGDEWRYLIRKLDQEGPQRWEPIILFAAGTDKRRNFTIGLMESLLAPTLGLSQNRRMCRNMVALKADARRQYVLPSDLEAKIAGIRQNIGKIDTPDKAIALADAGTVAIDFLRLRPDMSEEEEIACVHGVGRIEHPEAQEALAQYLRPDAPPAVLDALLRFYKPEEMAKVVNILRIPSLLSALQTRTGIPTEYRPLIDDLSPLQNLTHLQSLSLVNTRVTDLTPLQHLAQLRWLFLDETQESYLSQLPSLSQLPQLEIAIRRPESTLWVSSGMEMISIPAGDFLMGDDDRSDNPRRVVYLDAYSISKYPVTVEQYIAFVKATGHRAPDEPVWGWQENHPIVNVSWEDANAYCNWLGQQMGQQVTLPTEAQWEKAARGTDGRQYPWGDKWDESRCANSVGSNKLQSTVAVGSYPSGASLYGVLDMAGNVWEWCLDWYAERYIRASNTNNPTGPKTGSARVLRGGSWSNTGGDNFHCAYRIRNSPDGRGDYVGFRCALPVDSS